MHEKLSRRRRQATQTHPVSGQCVGQTSAEKVGIIPPVIGCDLSVDRGYGTGRFSSINNLAVSSTVPRAVDKRRQ
jgi:hypothetical protein